VAARIYAGRGGALVAAVYFWVIRGVVSLLVGPVLGETLPHLPLYFAEAAIVELVALRVGRDKPYAFGALAGVLIGTLGMAAEWGWSQFAMPTAWPAAMLDDAILLVPLTGLAAGVVGAFVGSAIGVPVRRDRAKLLRPGPAAFALIVIAAVVGYGLHVSPQKGMRAQIETTPPSGPEREVSVTARFAPGDAAEDADWVHAIAWQGHQKLVLEPLERVREGVYRTPRPVPTGGDWKTLIQVHKGASLVSAPVYMPSDPAIPAKGIPVERSATREMVFDHELLQRERKKDVPSVLPLLAYGAVGSIVLLFIGVLGWALTRLSRGFATQPARR
jgi:hypothetical protein